jgi:hypothetical protein
MFVVTTDPFLKESTTVSRRHLNAVMSERQSSPTLNEFLQELGVIALDGRVAAAAIGVDQDRVGSIEHSWIAYPTVGVHLNMQAGDLR